MKAKDLMIGDWYAFRGHPYKCTAYDIESLAECEEKGAPTDISEIPLTPEILEKNGWRKIMNDDNEECYRYYNSAGDGYVKIILWDGGCGDWNVEIKNYDKFTNNEIIYKNDFTFLKVHQLQHALKLCEIDKEIEL